ncbi:MAG TPA: hypothetical protein VGI71_23995 [Scandinavium sp.]|jgi:hypothetical protein
MKKLSREELAKLAENADIKEIPKGDQKTREQKLIDEILNIPDSGE